MTFVNIPQRGKMAEELEGVYEVFPFPTDQMTLLPIFGDCFEEWEHIHIGTLKQGAVREIRPPMKPDIGVMDDYATVDFEDGKKWREIERALGRKYELEVWPGSTRQLGRPGEGTADYRRCRAQSAFR